MNGKALSSNKAFLIARPAGKADKMLAELDKTGVNYLFQPLIEIRQLAISQADKQQIKQADALIFVSVSAVQCLQSQIEASLVTARLFAVGDTTAAALEDWLQRPVCVPEDQRSEGLINLPEFKQLAAKRVVVIRAEGGRELIKQQLLALAANVSYVLNYQRQVLALDGAALCQQWQQAGIGCIVATSNEILQHLFKLIPIAGHSWLTSLDWILVSPRMQQKAQQLGIATNKITLAENANDISLLHSIGQINRSYQ
ncbi:uroporphyrinogen-III synthase [Rheinheimera sp. WS51]|uniref:uroporphyrinogen-III synthase n=1 Tax=Rheinheimera sp. WS51 TaxID=3425886 RepID=UPI003D8DE73D